MNRETETKKLIKIDGALFERTLREHLSTLMEEAQRKILQGKIHSFVFPTQRGIQLNISDLAYKKNKAHVFAPQTCHVND